jgi:hypothetical protein
MLYHRIGEFYAQDFGTGNLKLLSRFFEKYPDYADKTFLSVKGAMDWSGMPPKANCSCVLPRPNALFEAGANMDDN